MRPVRDISAIENFRIDPTCRVGNAMIGTIKRDSIEPEPVGTIVLMAFRVTGYDKDCDGSLMARLEQIDSCGEATGWEETHIGLYPKTDLVVTFEEWQSLFHAEGR